eukprot:TRINITY_DN2275_c0_g1_i1.p1 TRINITY_DN2275_c0_g1~~TRINITY_DN2275_c0_g1_i1.p1  ORF type:complete len:344 (-),score=35.04 TRINITY_DN2275_c0_g1_i1:351-1382(-)
MSEKYTGWAVMAAGQPLQKFEYDKPELKSDEIEIQVTHNAVCHTDIHMRDNDWGVARYPFIPGHEVVGYVSKIGDSVKHLKVGERVGFGWIKYSCRACLNCLKGEENICHEGYTGTILFGNFGGFQPYMVAPADFAYKIPEGLLSKYAAPLLCAGTTVYGPLRKHITRPGMKVAILGIGGLGHLAIQFAAAMGAVVTAVSGSPNKEQQCKEMGASQFVLWKDADEVLTNTQDLLVNTISSVNDYTQQLQYLRPGGILCIVGLPVQEIKGQVLDVVFKQKTISGSIVAGRHDVNEMLQFAKDKNIIPLVETMKLSEVNEAMKKISANQARYKVILITDGVETHE